MEKFEPVSEGQPQPAPAGADAIRHVAKCQLAAALRKYNPSALLRRQNLSRARKGLAVDEGMGTPGTGRYKHTFSYLKGGVDLLDKWGIEYPKRVAEFIRSTHIVVQQDIVEPGEYASVFVEVGLDFHPEADVEEVSEGWTPSFNMGRTSFWSWTKRLEGEELEAVLNCFRLPERLKLPCRCVRIPALLRGIRWNSASGEKGPVAVFLTEDEAKKLVADIIQQVKDQGVEV